MDKGFIIITGATSGIGKETAKLFQDHGYSLLLLGRRIEKLQELENNHTLCKKVDVTDYNNLKAAINEATQKFGPIKCLVNSAGVMLLGLIQEQDPHEWKTMFDVNVIGTLNAMNLVLPSMIQRKEGTIINIGSVAGRFTFPNHAAYCGTKYAVHAITENVRKEVAKYSIRLVTIAPGAVETELLSHTTSSKIKSEYHQWKKEMGKVLEPGNVAQAIFYAYTQPKNVCIREVMLASTSQEL